MGVARAAGFSPRGVRGTHTGWKPVPHVGVPLDLTDSYAMDQRFEQSHRQALIDSVRRNAGSVGIAAALLIYFGFLAGLISPTGTSLFDWGNWIFFHTLRVGGIAMAGITVWSMLGRPVALLADALVSIVIGVLFVLSGVIMLIDGGRGQAFLNIIFGVMFASAGVRNGRVWAGRMTTRTNSADNEPGVFEAAGRSDVPEARPAESISSAPAKPTDAFTSEETTEPISPTKPYEAGAFEESVEPTASTDGLPESEPPDDGSPESEPPTPDAPGGFLASFADDDSPGRI